MVCTPWIHVSTQTMHYVILLGQSLPIQLNVTGALCHVCKRYRHLYCLEPLSSYIVIHFFFLFMNHKKSILKNNSQVV